MSKIICDVCGTSYPETTTQCPICGCVRPVDAVTVSNDNDSAQNPTNGSYTYVKGGRFSKANVKKRNSAKQTISDENDAMPESPEEKSGKNDKGLIIAICVLVAAIVAVVAYIAIHFFAPDQNDPIINTTLNTTVPTTSEDIVVPLPDDTEYTEEPTVILLPCEDIYLPESDIVLDKPGAERLLNYYTEPRETCDSMTFVSSNDKVATINEIGKIVAVGPGEATITVRCGEIEKQCRVVCNFESGSETPNDETTAPTTSNENTDTDATDVVLKLNFKYIMPGTTDVGDITLTRKGYKWTLYKDADNQIPSTEVTFTSSDPSVVTVDSFGIITTVGPGEAMITAQYQGQTVKCRILCKF